MHVTQPNCVYLRQCVLIVGALAVLTVCRAEAQLVDYDDFSGLLLDGTKWVGRQIDVSAGGTGVGLEIQRLAVEGTLLLQMRTVGGSASDSGLYFGENALLFRNPGPLTEIAFDLEIRELQVTGCAAGPASFAVARGFYSLFNDGSGDVIAFVEVRRSSASPGPEDELDVVAYLIHRTSSGDTFLGFTSLGIALLGQQVRLRAKWDRVNSLVDFQRDEDPAIAITYTNPVISPPSVPAKYLGAVGVVSDCLSAAPPVATVLAFFDNVQVNP